MAVRVPSFQNVFLYRFKEMSEDEYAAFRDSNTLRRDFFMRMNHTGFSDDEYENSLLQLRATVERMANRSIFVAPIDDDDQWRVTAYLIAISPTLQKTVQLERQQQQASSQARLAVHDAQNGSDDYDPAAAREVFEVLCSQCHDLADVDALPPETEAELHELMERMVENELEASEEEMAQAMRYMQETYLQ